MSDVRLETERLVLRLGWIEVIAAVAAKLGSRNRGPGRLPPPLADVQIEIWGQTRDEWRRR